MPSFVKDKYLRIMLHFEVEVEVEVEVEIT
jgi:hypothetical protein